MSEDTGKKEKPSMSGVMKTIMAMVGASLLGFFGKFVWGHFEEVQKNQEALIDRIKSLEDDKSKWATMAEIDRRSREQQVQLEVMRQVWSYEYGRQVPTGFPKTGEPKLIPPEELFKDIDRYRDMQQQKYPMNTKK